MYELSVWLHGSKEDFLNFDTLEEAIFEFGKQVEIYSQELRTKEGLLLGANIRIQKIEDIVSVIL